MLIITLIPTGMVGDQYDIHQMTNSMVYQLHLSWIIDEYKFDDKNNAFVFTEGSTLQNVALWHIMTL